MTFEARRFLRRAALADCDPLPTEQRERENKAEIEPD